MNNTSKTLIFFGSGPVAAESLAFLTKHFYIEAVITKPVPIHHKGTAPVEEYAQKNNLKLIYADSKPKLDLVFDQNRFTSPTGVVVDFGIIISPKVIDIFKYGIINSHFSLLPQWRGADPITAAILSGQEKTGVSLMVINQSLDTGKLIVCKSLKIYPSDNNQTLTKRLINLSNDLLRDYLPKYIKGELKPKNQPHPARATYSSKVKKSDGLIDWHKPANQIEREIRAYSEWPGSYTKIGDLEITVCRAEVVNQLLPPGQLLVTTKSITVGCQSDALRLVLLKPAGKKTMTAADLINGYRDYLA